MKDRYGKEIRERREFNFDEPPKGVSKVAIRLITILLFLTAAIIFFFPSNDGGGGAEAGRQNPRQPASEEPAP